jgi:FkbM family methyltransferase
MGIRTKLAGLLECLKFDNRWSLIAQRLLFPRQMLIVYRLNGYEIVMDRQSGDVCGARQALVSDMYQGLLREMSLPAHPKVLDLGAHIGGFSLLLAARGYVPSEVVCVEMNPNTASRLRFNMQHNLGDLAKVVPAAVCGEHRSIRLRLGKGATSDSIYASGASSTEYEIEGLTVDELCTRFFARGLIDLCKMDIEGAEYEVFEKAHYHSLRRVRYLVIEIHPPPGESKGRPAERLQELGFSEVPLGQRPRFGDVHLFRNESIVTA